MVFRQKTKDISYCCDIKNHCDVTSNYECHPGMLYLDLERLTKFRAGSRIIKEVDRTSTAATRQILIY